MKIAIEADVLVHDTKTGVHNYIQHLLQAAISLDDSNSYTLTYFGQPKDAGNFTLPKKKITTKPITWFPRRIYNLSLRTPFSLPLDIISGIKADLFVFPRSAWQPTWRSKKSITFIMDTTHLDYPETSPTWYFRWYLRYSMPRTLKRSTHIVTISESTKQSLIHLYGTLASHISVIHPAFDPHVYQPATPAEIARIKTKYGIRRDYLLYLGTLEPRKNITGIIRAYQALPKELQDQYQLVLAGGKGWGSAEIEAAARKVNSADLIRTGFIDQADIAALYSGARLFVFPSVFEGWGMPVAEAQACGTPVLTCDNSSLPEVGGSAAEYAKTGDQDDLNQKLTLLLQSPDRLKLMRAEGLKHARKFTWDTSAKQLLRLFKDLESGT